MINPKDEITNLRDLFLRIMETERRGASHGQEARKTCPGGRLLQQIANDEMIPEGPQIQEHLEGCPVCRFTLRTFRAGLKGESTDDMLEQPDIRTDPLRKWNINRLREWISSRGKTDASPARTEVE